MHECVRKNECGRASVCGGEIRVAIWVLQMEEAPLQHVALPGTSLHYRGECIILRRPPGIPWVNFGE